MNATMSEYRNSTEIQQEGETLTILRVADHKTGLFEDYLKFKDTEFNIKAIVDEQMAMMIQ